MATHLRQTLLGVRATLAEIAKGGLKRVGETLPRTDPQRLEKLPEDLWTLRDAFRLEVILRDYYAKRDSRGDEEPSNLRQRVSRLIRVLPEPPLEASKENSETQATPDPLVAALEGLKEGLFSKVKALADHYGKVNLYVVDQLREINKRSGEFEDARPSSRRIVAAQTLIGSAQNQAQTLSLSLDRQDALATELSGQTELSAALGKNRTAAEALSKQLDQFENANTLLEELLLGDRSRWVGEQVTLYYFGEVDRLIRALNPKMTSVGQLAELQQKAAKARRDLSEAQLNVEDERQAVSRLQTRIREMEAEQKTIQARFKAAVERVTALTRGQARLTARRTNAAQRLEQLREAATSNPDNPTLKREIKLAEERIKTLDRQESDESEDLLDAQAEKTEAEAALTASRREEENLPNQIEDAREQLVAAQSRVRQLTRDAYLQAQEDLDAFVEARDNRPFLFAPPQPFSTDPVQRVALYGYADSKTLFMRGLPEDVARVRELVEIFDRPTPQARLTLWTLELNSQADQRSIEKLNRGIAILEERLADTRADLLSATALLRHCVNTIANQAAQEGGNSGVENQLARYHFYEAEVVERLKLPEIGLHETSKPTSQSERTAFLKANLPDPAATTTFGEALMVLSLAKEEHQEKVLEMFVKELERNMPTAMKRGKEYRDELFPKKDAQTPPITHVKPWFSSLRAALGISFADSDTRKIKSKPSQGDTALLSAQQTEILRALQRVALQRFILDLRENFDRMSVILQEGENQPLGAEQLREITHLQSDLYCKWIWVNREFPEMAFDYQDLEERISKFIMISGEYKQASEKVKAAAREEKKTKEESFQRTKISQKVNRELKQKLQKITALLKSLQEESRQVTPKQKQITQEPLANAKRKLESATDTLDASSSLQNALQHELDKASQELNPRDSPEEIERELTEREAESPQTLSEVLNLIDQMLGALRMDPGSQAGSIIASLKNARHELTLAKSRAENLQTLATQAQQKRKLAFAALQESDDKQKSLENWRAKNRFGIEELSQKYAPLLIQRASATSNNARIAAADQMLKELITAAEDDLDRHFVRPLLHDLREDMKDQGINVGILNRTSVLASNRQIARVDPLASAQLEMGSTTDLIDATRQLATLYSATQVPGVASVVNALDAMPRKEDGGIYGVTSGGRFEVTPVIDPSGQALRFKFDYVLQNQLRDPDGTVDPLLPRVTRHTINTEVQLSNLEIRNISQFEASTKLGLPTKYTGGLPILNDIPGVREIPLIGWFKRRAGKAAAIQQSIVLAQTTIYPTIGDISGLLVSTNQRSPAPSHSKP